MAKKKAKRVASEPHPNNKRMIQLRERYQLSRRDLAELICQSKSAVDTYLYPPNERHYRELRDGPLRLLEFELGLRGPTRFHGKRVAA